MKSSHISLAAIWLGSLATSCAPDTGTNAREWRTSNDSVEAESADHRSALRIWREASVERHGEKCYLRHPARSAPEEIECERLRVSVAPGIHGRDTLAALFDRVNAEIDSTRTADELVQYFVSVPTGTERDAALMLLRSGKVEWVMPDYTFKVGIW